MSGAFLTSREIFENPIWQNVVEFRLFFLIYGKAVFSEEGCMVGGVKLQRGQWLRSFRNLQSDLEYIENRSVKRYSLSRIKRAIESLVKQNRIEIRDAELGTLFTVSNYSLYQGFENYKRSNENAERTQGEQQRNSNGTATERRRNNNKNAIKENNEKKDINNTVGDTGEKSPVSLTQKRKAPAIVDEDFLISLEGNPAFKGIDVRKEHGKMLAWIQTPRGAGKLPTRQRFLNWLNRCTPQDQKAASGKEEKFDAMEWLKNMNLEEMKNGES